MVASLTLWLYDQHGPKRVRSHKFNGCRRHKIPEAGYRVANRLEYEAAQVGELPDLLDQIDADRRGI
jgi:hypothetical protein